jgi:hypothetical protein
LAAIMVAVPTSKTCTMAGLLGAEGGDRGGQGLGVVALVDRVHLVFFLRLVEALGEGIDRVTQIAAHGVPELDFGTNLPE